LAQVDAMDLMNELGDGRQRDLSLHRLATDWAVKNPAALSSWVKQLPDSTASPHEASAIIRILAHPMKAAGD
jgi:hypothetical protein